MFAWIEATIITSFSTHNLRRLNTKMMTGAQVWKQQLTFNKKQTKKLKQKNVKTSFITQSKKIYV